MCSIVVPCHSPRVAAFAAWPLGRLGWFVRWLVRSVEYVQAADLADLHAAGRGWAALGANRHAVFSVLGSRLLQFFGSSEVQFPSVCITLIDSQTYK